MWKTPSWHVKTWHPPAWWGNQGFRGRPIHRGKIPDWVNRIQDPDLRNKVWMEEEFELEPTIIMCIVDLLEN